MADNTTPTVMQTVQTTMSTPIVKNSDGSTLISLGTIVLIALGAVAYWLYDKEFSNKPKKRW